MMAVNWSIGSIVVMTRSIVDPRIMPNGRCFSYGIGRSLAWPLALDSLKNPRVCNATTYVYHLIELHGLHSEISKQDNFTAQCECTQEGIWR